MTVKFHEKNVSIYGEIQVSEGTPIATVAADAIAVTTLEGSVVRETEAFEYLGDSLSRDEITTLKDESGEVNFESFMPHLGALDVGLAVDDAPYSKFFRACGGEVTVDGGTGIVTVTNSTISNKLLTLDYHKASPEATGGDDKRWQFSDCRGGIDISFEAGSRIQLAFKFMGNYSNVGNPSMETAVIPDFGSQKFDIASVVRLQNMQTSTIRQLLGTEASVAIANIADAAGTVTVDTSAVHGYVTGERVTIAGTTSFDEVDVEITVVDTDTFTYLSALSGAPETTGTTTRTAGIAENMCVNGINATNFFGFNYERFLLTCQEGFTKTGVPTDVVVTMLEDEVGGTDFDPEANIENFYEITFKYGTAAGKYVTLFWSKVQLADVKEAKVASYFGKEVTLRNIEHTTITFS